MKNKFSIALSLAVILSMLLTSLAFADNVVNNVTVGGNDTFTAPGSTTVGYQINRASAGGDPQAGCNVEDGTSATVTLSVPAGVTASTTSLTFTACNAFQNVTFSSSIPGDYAINVSSISDAGGGGYNNVANFTLHVLAPPAPSDTTPPVITPNIVGTLGSNGWYVTDVIVSWSVVDNESTVSSMSGCGPTTINTDTAGVILTCTATSAGGTTSQSVTIKRDATSPTISGSASPAPNGAGWNKTDVAISFSCSDATSGVASCGPNQTLSSDGAGQSVSGTAVDNAGNSASATVSDINIDKTAPTISGSASPAPNGAGWNKTDVAVSFSCSDATSGVASCGPNQTLSSDGAGQSVSGTAVDNAGNSASATVSDINIDKTAPTVSLVGGPADSASYYFGSVPAAPTCTASDATSGLAGACSVSGYSAAVGVHTVTASATDNAGNSASASATYTVLAWNLNGFYQPVDMSGVFNVVKGGSTVPLKFEVFAGPTELTSTSVVKSFVQTKVACDGGSPTDEIEVTTTGGTSLRYDTTAGQFVQNWQTPKLPWQCYKVTMTTQDDSSLVAFFKLK